MKKFLTIIITMFLVLGLTIGNVFAADEAQWEEKTPMSEARQTLSSCAIGDKIYVLGGIYNSNGTTIYSDTVEIYDTKTDSWAFGEPMPEKMCDFTASAVDGKIYTFGGSNYGKIVNSVYVYDIKNNTWTTAEPMLTARHDLASVVIDKEIYVMGGSTTTSSENVVEIYNTETNSWRTGNSLNYPRERFSAVVADNNIYIMGGHSTGMADFLNIMEIYNLETGVWSVGTPLPKSLADVSASVIDNKIYVTGGYEYKNGCVNTVYIYSTSQKTWGNGVSLLNKRCNHCSEAVGGRIYVIGGISSAHLNTVESLMVKEENTTQLAVLLNIGEDVQLGVSYNLFDNTGLLWSSTDENIATVDTNGKVTAVGVGETCIYAEKQDGTYKDFIPIRVVEANADELRLAVNLDIGEKANLYLSDDPSQVEWSSMDESIATISETGQITAKKRGLAIVQGKLDEQAYQMYVRSC